MWAAIVTHSVLGDTQRMALPISLPIKPMLAKPFKKSGADAGTMPTGELLYEPKWDGFRAIASRDGDEIGLHSRDLKPLLRYFPELEKPLREQLPERCVLDGEVVIATDGRLDFDALLQRIHPAKSRVTKLAAEFPASFVAWDLLAIGDEDLTEATQEVRSERLVTELGSVSAPIHLTPVTRDPDIATEWFHRFEGAGLDGVIAKPLAATYQPGKRVMFKVKHKRTADCVVAGFRWHKNGPGTEVGSLMLGLYDQAGVLHSVGVASSFSEKRRVELALELSAWRDPSMDDHPWKSWRVAEEHEGKRLPGATSRWNRGKALEWEPLRADLVAEVSYDHMQGTRFRHTTRLVRFRDDKPALECDYKQLEVSPPLELSKIFAP